VAFLCYSCKVGLSASSICSGHKKGQVSDNPILQECGQVGIIPSVGCFRFAGKPKCFVTIRAFLITNSIEDLRHKATSWRSGHLPSTISAYMRCTLATAAIVASVLLLKQAECQTIDTKEAEAAFVEAKQLSELDGGRLWGARLYGPMIFVDPSTNSAIANEADSEGVLRKIGNVWEGNLPDSFPVANTAIEWEGMRWTMVQWPLPQATLSRDRLLAHEMFHRIEPALGIPTKDAVNGHLDSKDGRIWILLEWRALAAALSARSDEAQESAIADALLFRRHRQELFAGSSTQERALELNEGLAEYTGVVLSEPDATSARWHAIARLADPTSSQSLVRSFAYTSGPAYGLLLDARREGWRKQISPTSDLAMLLSDTVSPKQLIASQRATVYGGAALQLQETERKLKTDSLQKKYRELLVSGPTLTLPISDNLNFSFDPGELAPLDEEGTVYPTLHATDDWGSIEITQGALVSFPKKILRVAAPAVGTSGTVNGPGWELKLATGWFLEPTDKGSFVLRKK
jgi:hypothetical protein